MGTQNSFSPESLQERSVLFRTSGLSSNGLTTATEANSVLSPPGGKFSVKNQFEHLEHIPVDTEIDAQFISKSFSSAL
jgi:hypothetical protein